MLKIRAETEYDEKRESVKITLIATSEKPLVKTVYMSPRKECSLTSSEQDAFVQQSIEDFRRALLRASE